MTSDYAGIIGAGIGIVGTLGAVILGQRMSQTQQRKQWLLDRRTDEFKELLAALADSLRVCMMMHAGAVLDSDAQQEIINTHSAAMRVIRSRIFVFADVAKLDIELRWSQAVNAHKETLDVESLAKVFNEIRVRVVEIASQRRFF